MPDDFGTVSMKPRSPDRTREIDVMRQQYRRHREALAGMSADAPTQHLAVEYRRLLHEIDTALTRLDELEKGKSGDSQPGKSAPGTRPLVAGPLPPSGEDEPASAQSRIILIVVAGLLVLSLIGWLIWRASGRDRTTEVAVATTETTQPAADTTTAAATPVGALSVEPPAHDYGVIRKGTRAARQFEIVNTTAKPIKIDVARSTCRCLYYDYADLIPPNGKETLTVTVDAAKADAGDLEESVKITAESDRSVTASFDITAVIR